MRIPLRYRWKILMAFAALVYLIHAVPDRRGLPAVVPRQGSLRPASTRIADPAALLFSERLAAVAALAAIPGEQSSCPESLQSLVARAAPGSVLRVPPCTYREAVIISKLLTLDGQQQAEIRGSDVWSTGWTKEGDFWTHPGPPSYRSHGNCRKGTTRCLWLEQAFYNGRPLRHVAENPAAGQFSVSNGVLTIRDDPSQGVVEVSARPKWIEIRSDGVTIRGFKMRHCSNDAQTGAISSQGHSDITISDNLLSDAHGAIIHIKNGSNVRVLHNDISRAGQLGIGLSVMADCLVQGNHLHENNTEDYSGGWEAGGLKAVKVARISLDSNEVGLNRGPGLWCDGDCQQATFTNNRVHDNEGDGIKYEISHAGTISGNSVWNNGWGFHVWGWGAGINVQNSDHVDVYNNILAWNAHGISVIEQRRGYGHFVTNVSVHDNTIVMQDQQGSESYALAWLTDIHDGLIFAPEGTNTGQRNRFGFSGAAEANSRARFAWRGRNYRALEEFRADPGGQGSEYLDKSKQDRVLSAAGIPLSAPSPPF
jgi:parallel beta-helix repeat protein